MKKLWHNIDERYKISEYGEIFDIINNKYLKTHLDKYGYIRVYFNSKIYLLHRLVATYFIINSFNKKQVNHKDGNKLNNHYSNLEWVTIQENLDHATKTGLRAKGESVNTNILTEEQVKEIKNLYIPRKVSMLTLAKKYGVSKATICHIITGRNWKHIN